MKLISSSLAKIITHIIINFKYVALLFTFG